MSSLYFKRLETQKAEDRLKSIVYRKIAKVDWEAFYNGYHNDIEDYANEEIQNADERIGNRCYLWLILISLILLYLVL